MMSQLTVKSRGLGYKIPQWSPGAKRGGGSGDDVPPTEAEAF